MLKNKEKIRANEIAYFLHFLMSTNFERGVCTFLTVNCMFFQFILRGKCPIIRPQIKHEEEWLNRWVMGKTGRLGIPSITTNLYSNCVINVIFRINTFLFPVSVTTKLRRLKKYYLAHEPEIPFYFFDKPKNQTLFHKDL